MLRIAVQAKGRLFDETMSFLEESDIKLSATKRTLLVQSSNFPLEVLFLRDDDIPQTVATGVADLGIVGENEFMEKAEDAEIIKRLGFSKCRLSLALPKDIEYPGPQWFEGKKIATSYPGILSRYLKKPPFGILLADLAVVLHVAARSAHVHPDTVVRKARGSEPCIQRSDGHALGIGSREGGGGGVLVACGEDRNATLDNTVGRSGILDEVVQRLFLQRIGRFPLLLGGGTQHGAEDRLVGIGRDISPTALQDDRAVVGRILDRFGLLVQRGAHVARKDLARHDLHTAAAAVVSAGDAADAPAVAVDGGDGSGDMRAVARVALARPGNQARVLHEIVAVNVVLIAVAVGVFAGIEHLAVVLPHIGLQVGVGVHHTLVEHGDDDRRIARAHLPRLHAIDVATGDDLRVRIVLLERIVARIVVMPLVFQRGIGFERQSQPRKVDVAL